VSRRRAYRDGLIVAARVQVAILVDDRLGIPAGHQRRHVGVRFQERLDSTLYAELRELVQRRGAASCRAAERMEPITVVVDGADGRQQIVGAVQPPQSRRGELREIQFPLREIHRS
jgi:hypothetical protein